jgi:hypothetical protein
MSVGAVFLLIGLAVAAFSIGLKGRARRRFQSWPAAAGVVTEQEVASGTLTTTQTTRQIMHYSYTVNGVEYGGKLQMIIGNTMGENVRKQAFLDSYPVGKSIAVHYDPADPSKSQLDAGSESGSFLTLIGVGLAAVGVVSILTRH